MRAVNLIPLDERRGGTGGGAGSGVFVLLGGLSVLLVAVLAFVLISNSINERKGELIRLSRDAARVEAQAQALKPYRDFATLREKRVATVTALAISRFDWERTMREIARVLPADVSLTNLTATVAPGVATVSSAGGGASLRGSVNAPAVDLIGCTSSQSEVSRIMSRLRRMTGVTRVALASSEKSERGASAAPAGGGTGNSSDCKAANPNRPQFNITVFFAPLPGAPQAAPGAPGAPAPPPASPPANSGQPVSNPAGGAR